MKPDEPVFQATTLGDAYRAVTRLPVSILLDNVRSLYNVGAFFRTADAVRADRIWLAGITPTPRDPRIAKTALGAERRVAWSQVGDAAAAIEALRSDGVETAAIETSLRAVDVFDWRPRFPVCLVFGHEVDGISREVLDLCDVHVRIPTLGMKQSLNVATAGGVVLYELLRKYRQLAAPGSGHAQYHGSMTDEAPKSAYELAMERLRRKDEEAGVESTPLTEKQRAEIAEARNFCEAKLAEREVLHQSTLRRTTDPEAAAVAEQEYHRDRERFASARDAKIERIRRGGV